MHELPITVYTNICFLSRIMVVSSLFTKPAKSIYLGKKLSGDEESKFRSYLHDVYFNLESPAAYSSPMRVLSEVRRHGLYKNVGLHRVKKYLTGFASYGLYKPRLNKTTHPRVRIQSVYQQLSIDLCDVSRDSSDNSGIKFLFVGIDVLSKYAYVIPLKNKTADEVVRAADSIFSKRKYEAVFSDLGKEFTNSKFVHLLQSYGIRQIFASVSGKSSVAERFIKSLRLKIARYKHGKNTTKYIDALSKLVKGYNSTPHSQTKMIPMRVNKYNDYIARDNLYRGQTFNKVIPYQYKIDQFVRISGAKSLFSREFYERWSREIFRVKSRFRRDNINLFTVVDCAGDKVVGVFFASELSKVDNADAGEYPIEKILDEKKIAGVPYILVKWENFSDKCSSWIPKSSVRDL